MTTPGEVKTVIAYCRQSKAVPGEREADALSFDVQESAIQRYCAERGWQIVRTVRDHDLSGENWQRPGMQELLAAAETGDVDAVIVYKLSRFARDVLYQEVTHRELQKRNVALYSVTEQGIDKTLIRMVYGGMAQQHNEDHREWLIDALRARAKRGLHHGRPPLGYINAGDRTTGKRLEIVPEEAEIVRRIYRLRADGMGVPAIANLLNDEGVTSKEGNLMGASSVRSILATPTYAGLIAYRGTVTTAASPEVVPPIIDRALWEQVQRSFDGYTRATRQPGITWLSGLVKHGCGLSMSLANAQGRSTGDGERERVYSFSCSAMSKDLAHRCTERPGTLRVEAMEAAVEACLIEDLTTRPLDPAALLAARAEVLGQPNAVKRRAALIKQKTALIESISRAEQLVTSGRRDLGWFDAFDQDAQTRLAAIETELTELNALPTEVDLAARVDAIARLVPVAALLPLSPDAMRRALAALGHAVFAGGVVSIRYAPEYRDCFPHPAKVRPVYVRSGDGGTWRLDRVGD